MDKNISKFPTSEQIEIELKRERYKNRFKAILRSTIYTLITVAAVAIFEKKS